MIGLADKGGAGGVQQTPGSQISALFGVNPGYQQTPLNPAIAAPQYNAGGMMPTPDQAAAATRARIMARNPVVAAPAAPKPQDKPQLRHNPFS